MRFIVLPILCFFCLVSLFAQSSRAVLEVYPPAEQGRWQSPVYEIPLTQSDPFISYFLKWEGGETSLKIRFSRDGENWTDWQAMPRDEHSPELPLSIMGTTEVDMRFFQLENEGTERGIRQIACHFYSPGATERTLAPTLPHGGRSCSDLTPEYFVRSEWCPTGNCKEHPNPSFTDVTHLVVHHSAGTNESDDWPAVVRSIWDYHVNGRGWSDIGYNWLVDPEGKIYEGRSNDAIGAHFCGTNTGTIGVCMLGNFTEVSPKPEAIATLKQLLSWKACENGIDPTSSVYHASSEMTLPTIIGHRDGCATACPGDLFYPQLPDIRTDLTNEPPTSVNRQDPLLAFEVYPNPSSGLLQIVLPENAPDDLQAGLFDLLGQPVAGPITLKETHTWSTSIPNGTYFLVLRSKARLVGVKKVSIFH